MKGCYVSPPLVSAIVFIDPWVGVGVFIDPWVGVGETGGLISLAEQKWGGSHAQGSPGRL